MKNDTNGDDDVDERVCNGDAWNGTKRLLLAESARKCVRKIYQETSDDETKAKTTKKNHAKKMK